MSMRGIMLRLTVLPCLGAIAIGAARAQQGSSPTPDAPTSPQANDRTARPPVPVAEPEADFPAQARHELRKGKCLVSMTVDASGRPLNLKAVECSDPVFATNSMSAAANYRFKPALDQEGNPVATNLTVEIDFQITAMSQSPAELGTDALRCWFATPPGFATFAPDAHGVYPLSRQMAAPAVTHFVDRGLNGKLFASRGKLTCDVLLTISEKGRPSDASIAHCDQPDLEAPVIASLLKSRFSPGRLQGKAVPVRVLVHLIYDGSTPRL
jgi:TonB family protein